MVANDEDLAATVRMLRDHERTDKYLHEYFGVNSRLDTLQAAVLGAKLSHMEEWNEARRAVAAKYDASLGEFPWLTLPAQMPGGRHVYHLYVVRSERREELRQHLSDSGIGVGIHYPVPLHLQPAFRALGYAAGDFPVSERLAASILSIPMYPEVSEAQLHRVVQTIGAFYP